MATCAGPPVELTLNTVNISIPDSEFRIIFSVLLAVIDSMAIVSFNSGYLVDDSVAVVNS